MPTAARCADRLALRALPGVPLVQPGDALGPIILRALEAADLALADGDAIAVCSKIVSRAEGRFVDLATVAPGPRAREVSRAIGRDPRLVELILAEAPDISRQAPGVLVVRHRLGFVCANAGIDQSNARPLDAKEGSGPWVLLLPRDPDGTAAALRSSLRAGTGAEIGVVISDSFGRPFRYGTVGAAIGVAGLPALRDQRGERDLFGRTLEQTVTALADQVAAAADLVAGQADEGRPIVHVRGLSFVAGAHSARELSRAPGEDLYA